MHALRLNPTTKSVVPFNVKEQSVGEPSVQLASCLGVLVRRNIPLTHKDWRLVPQQAKVNIWKIFEQRFIVPEYYQEYYFGKMGKYLKEARSRKATLVLDAYDKLQGEEREKKLAQLMPTSMTVSEWEKFVKRVNSTEFRVNRIKIQEVRSKYTTPHTRIREGYARREQQVLKTTEPIDRADLWVNGHQHTDGRDPKPVVQEAFKKIEEAKSNHGSDGGESSVTNDLLTKALGEDKGVRLKGMGYGVTRKKIASNSHYKLIIKECQETCRAMNDRLVMLEERSSKCVCDEVSHSHRASPVARNNQASTRRVVPCTTNASTTHTTTPVSRPNEVKVPEKFTACKLLSWYKDGEVVADAEICETDPAKEIHGMPIGFGAYTVCVLTTHVMNAHVYKQTSEFKYVADAVASVISWPKDRIVY
ncbi:uncharacterized protein LOC113300297 isoform X2 [Papaver somniferum]|uniref:uncharacterized protein LOC113300297 isoform X2 n=1 Tax=Papaver somniferum TaxID=3469 RepID=UPI000E6F7D6A|nr:uncharacterized protein LOC113300297 isoform X2 [Papaver somniferum]